MLWVTLPSFRKNPYGTFSFIYLDHAKGTKEFQALLKDRFDALSFRLENWAKITKIEYLCYLTYSRAS